MLNTGNVKPGKTLFGTPLRCRKKPIVLDAIRYRDEFEVKTKEGTMRGKPGDILMFGISGEKYPIDKDIFERTYDILGDELEPKTRWKVTHYEVYLKPKIGKFLGKSFRKVSPIFVSPKHISIANPHFVTLDSKGHHVMIPWSSILAIKGIKEEVKVEVEPEEQPGACNPPVVPGS